MTRSSASLRLLAPVADMRARSHTMLSGERVTEMACLFIR